MIAALASASGSCLATLAEPLERAAIVASHLDRAAFLGVAAVEDRLVAVGERGLVALSDDQGKSWRQARSPVSVGLTAVAFPTPQVGWAVGHFGVVLRSVDGGETWAKVLDGVQAARIVSDGVPTGTTSRRAAQLVEEGPDKPFLDLHFDTPEQGWIVGAFGLMLHTVDGGRHWTSRTLELPNPKAAHLYAICAASGTLYVAGEQGLAMRSEDGGATFQRLSMPYQGSWFTAVASDDGTIVLGGLRGKVYGSADRGQTWQVVDLASPVAVTAAARGRGGRIFLANQAGQVYVLAASAAHATRLDLPPLPVPTALAETRSGGLVVGTVRGMRQVPAVAPAS